MTRRTLLAVAAAGLTLTRGQAAALPVMPAPARVPRPGGWDDLPAALHARLRSLGVTDWARWARTQRADTARRVDEGRFDHLVAVALQSTRFTTRPAIEPAISARAFIATGRIPDDAEARLLALASALERDDADLGAVRRLSPREAGPPLRAQLRTHYARMMRFLHEKEVVARTAAEVGRLYETRGLSTDTGVDAGFAVAEGIGAMPLDRPARHVLVVGPGVEFGPRTGLDDASLGQSVQPLAVLDALRATGHAAPDIGIDTMDVNEAVLEVVTQAAHADLPPSLVLLTSLSGHTHTLLPSYLSWVEGWGRTLGIASSSLTARPDGRRVRVVRPAREAWARVSAAPGHVALDVIPAAYDVIVATNVLAYLDDAALVAAAGMLAVSLRPGGVLLHNETRDLMALASADAGMPMVQARSVAFSAPDARGQVAHDWTCVHRRTA
ncbi:hypothetical protein [Luteitalea sp.]